MAIIMNNTRQRFVRYLDEHFWLFHLAWLSGLAASAGVGIIYGWPFLFVPLALTVLMVLWVANAIFDYTLDKIFARFESIEV